MIVWTATSYVEKYSFEICFFSCVVRYIYCFLLLFYTVFVKDTTQSFLPVLTENYVFRKLKNVHCGKLKIIIQLFFRPVPVRETKIGGFRQFISCDEMASKNRKSLVLALADIPERQLIYCFLKRTTIDMVFKVLFDARTEVLRKLPLHLQQLAGWPSQMHVGVISPDKGTPIYVAFYLVSSYYIYRTLIFAKAKNYNLS